MLTASYMNQPIVDVQGRRDYCIENNDMIRNYIGWDGLDAPTVIPSGSHYSYEPILKHLPPFSMPSGYMR